MMGGRPPLGGFTTVRIDVPANLGNDLFPCDGHGASEYKSLEHRARQPTSLEFSVVTNMLPNQEHHVMENEWHDYDPTDLNSHPEESRRIQVK
jgi:hypothetical protein